jgi:hypothetical protein
MGYALVFGSCISCMRTFGFNPLRVPSIRVNGEKEPVCRECIERANPLRKKNGLPEFTIHPEAYEPVNENEL